MDSVGGGPIRAKRSEASIRRNPTSCNALHPAIELSPDETPVIIPAAQSALAKEEMEGNSFEFTALAADGLSDQTGARSMMSDVAAESPPVEEKNFLAEA